MTRASVEDIITALADLKLHEAELLPQLAVAHAEERRTSEQAQQQERRQGQQQTETEATRAWVYYTPEKSNSATHQHPSATQQHPTTRQTAASSPNVTVDSFHVGDRVEILNVIRTDFGRPHNIRDRQGTVIKIPAKRVFLRTVNGTHTNRLPENLALLR